MVYRRESRKRRLTSGFMKWGIGEDFCATKGYLLITKEPEPSLSYWLSQMWGREGRKKDEA